MAAFTNEVVGPLTDTELRATPVPVSGTVDIGNFPATQNVAVTSSVEVEVKNDAGNAIPVVMGVSSSATTTQVTSTGSNQTLLAANASRKKAILFFNSGIWDLKLGSGASPTSRMLRVPSNNYLLEIEGYTGQIDAACTTAAKLVDVTELA